MLEPYKVVNAFLSNDSGESVGMETYNQMYSLLGKMIFADNSAGNRLLSMLGQFLNVKDRDIIREDGIAELMAVIWIKKDTLLRYDNFNLSFLYSIFRNYLLDEIRKLQNKNTNEEHKSIKDEYGMEDVDAFLEREGGIQNEVSQYKFVLLSNVQRTVENLDAFLNEKEKRILCDFLNRDNDDEVFIDNMKQDAIYQAFRRLKVKIQAEFLDTKEYTPDTDKEFWHKVFSTFESEICPKLRLLVGENATEVNNG